MADKKSAPAPAETAPTEETVMAYECPVTGEYWDPDDPALIGMGLPPASPAQNQRPGMGRAVMRLVRAPKSAVRPH